MVIRRELLYPIFLQCCQYCEDGFWENIFENLAYGKTPYGSYISRGYICCSSKKKTTSCKIEKMAPDIMYQQVYNLLVNDAGVMSEREKNKKKLLFHTMNSDSSEIPQSWGKIRKKNLKKVLVEKFVLGKKEQFNLSISKTRNLLSFIMISVSFKTLSSKDIVLEDGIIKEIKGIRFTDKNYSIDLEEIITDTSKSCESLSSKIDLKASWEKYSKDLVSLSRWKDSDRKIELLKKSQSLSGCTSDRDSDNDSDIGE